MQTEIDLLAEKMEKKYDPTAFLGRLAWYSVPETVRITHEDLSKRMTEAFKGLSVHLGPLNKVRPVDVFKRGCTDAQRKKYLPTAAEIKALTSLWVTGVNNIAHVNYLVRNAGTDANHVWRVLIRESVDTQGHEIGYDEVAKIQYNRTTNDIQTVKSDVIDSIPVEDDILHGIVKYFLEETTIFTPYSIREYVRRGLEGYLRAIRVRPSGGIYFVQEQFSQPLAALESVINGIGGSVHTLPLLDDSKQREMLRAAFEDESTSDITAMMDEIRDILKNGKTITSDRFADFKVRYDHQKTKLLEYSAILDEAMDTTASYLELAQQQIKVLIDKVDVTDKDYH